MISSPKFIGLSKGTKQVVMWILISKFILLFSTFLAFRFGAFYKEQYLNQFVYPTTEITWKTAYRTWDTCPQLFLVDHGRFP